AVASGGRTDDVTPQLSGGLGAALGSGQTLKIYDGDTALAAEPTVSGRSWTLELANPLSEGEHRFSAQVVAADGQTGTRSAVFTITVAPLVWQGISPSELVRATPTTLRLSGSGWPASGWQLDVSDDPDAACESPTDVTDTSMAVRCSFHLPGTRQLALTLNGQPVAQPTVTVASNVRGVTWSSPSTGGFGTATVNAGETVQFKVSGTQLQADAVLAVTVGGCTATPTETGTPSPTERTFSCMIGLGTPAGHQAGVLHATDASGPQLAAWQLPVAVPQVTAPSPLLPHSGVTASQCYSTSGGITLGACSAADAIALNGQQDGHRVGVQAMSFSRVGSYALNECVKDNRTGLVWEGKTPTGMRSAASQINFAGLTDPALDAYDASFYVSEVNRLRLCGYSDWRLPTLLEMQSIADYGITSGAMLSPTWFPNSGTQGFHWTATIESSGAGRWVMDMGEGRTVYEPTLNRDGLGYLHQVRLVRGGS
ncbi:MAG: DUF1566 domain-containing protein, partial [Burkholderiales bacterium]|nr:DUF1566 domain-containing protein [Burkholderiales bacterium]